MMGADLRQTSIDPGVQSLTSEYKAGVRELLSLLEEVESRVQFREQLMHSGWLTHHPCCHLLFA